MCHGLSALAGVFAVLASGAGCYRSHERGRAPDAGLDAPGPLAPDALVRDAGDCAARGDMVAVSGAHPYRIEVTEVTQREYARFLSCATPTPGPAGCVGAELRPGRDGDFDPDACPEVPVHDVSWCAAAAYCEWAGRRLCLLEDEWMPACLSTRARVAPSGVVRDPRACVLGAYADGLWDGTSADVPQPVRSAPDCRGLEAPFDQVFDVLGNVNELVTRSGSPPSQYVGYSSGSGPRNPCAVEGAIDVTDHRGDFGFRCCAD